MAVRFVNNFSAALAAGIDSVETVLTFAAGVGDAFRLLLGSPLSTDHIYLTLYNSGGDIEYVKCTSTSGDEFTVVRGQDNSTARAWLADDMVACRPNAAALEEATSIPTDLAHSGINIDITELRGLTTPLSKDQGGTGGVDGGVPTGAVMHFAMTSAPAGWLKANGAAISRTTYAALFAAVGTTFGVGDGVATFNLPDLRGEFVRGLDDGRGIDVDRVIGAAQSDAMQGHWHEKYSAAYNQASLGGSTFAAENASGNTAAGPADAVRAPITDGTHGTPRIASENRPRNIALLVCIKY